jgi:hypothetical protein
MRLAALLLTIGSSCIGCAPLAQVASTVRYETGYRWSEFRLDIREHRYAQRGWNDFQRQENLPSSTELRAGFIAGYKAFLHSGKREPPAVPPRRFWASGSPAGGWRSAQWYQGFELGAISAEASGLRSQFLVPVSPLTPNPTPLIVGIQTEPQVEMQHVGSGSLETLPPGGEAAPGNVAPLEPLPEPELPIQPPSDGTSNPGGELRQPKYDGNTRSGSESHLPQYDGNSDPGRDSHQTPSSAIPTWDFPLSAHEAMGRSGRKLRPDAGGPPQTARLIAVQPADGRWPGVRRVEPLKSHAQRKTT